MTTDQTRNGGDSPRDDTNEGRFMESLRRFMNEVPKLVEQQKRNDLARVIRDYGESRMTKDDPLLLLQPGKAAVMRRAQESVAPSLTNHPFFRRVAEVSRFRWSKEIGEVIDASNYLIMKDLIRPKYVPRPEVLALFASPVRWAWLLSVFFGARQTPTSRSLNLDDVIAAFKRNW